MLKLAKCAHFFFRAHIFLFFARTECTNCTFGPKKNNYATDIKNVHFSASLPRMCIFFFGAHIFFFGAHYFFGTTDIRSCLSRFTGKHSRTKTSNKPCWMSNSQSAGKAQGRSFPRFRSVFQPMPETEQKTRKKLDSLSDWRGKKNFPPVKNMNILFDSPCRLYVTVHPQKMLAQASLHLEMQRKQSACESITILFRFHFPASV